MVAHRLKTVITSHQIVALSAGSLMECDAPAALVARPDSVLSHLVSEHGAEEAEELRALARGAR